MTDDELQRLVDDRGAWQPVMPHKHRFVLAYRFIDWTVAAYECKWCGLSCLMP